MSRCAIAMAYFLYNIKVKFIQNTDFDTFLLARIVKFVNFAAY